MLGLTNILATLGPQHRLQYSEAVRVRARVRTCVLPDDVIPYAKIQAYKAEY